MRIPRPSSWSERVAPWRLAVGAILARVDIPSFLRMYPPFDELDDERLAEVVRHTHIEFFPVGAVIQHQAGAPSGFLYIVRTGRSRPSTGS